MARTTARPSRAVRCCASARSPDRPRTHSASLPLRAGIFGTGPVAPPQAGRASAAHMTKSTVFDAPVQQAPPPRPTTGTRSDQVGGIFGAALAAPPAPRGNMTKSSIVGGIFSSESAYGQQGAYPEPPRSARGPKPVIDQSRSAGQASKAPKENDIFNSAPLAEVGSANFRSNPNKPSIEGGIFGAPPPMSKPSISRGNPNASSIEGGIFGN